MRGYVCIYLCVCACVCVCLPHTQSLHTLYTSSQSENQMTVRGVGQWLSAMLWALNDPAPEDNPSGLVKLILAHRARRCQGAASSG